MVSGWFEKHLRIILEIHFFQRGWKIYICGVSLKCFEPLERLPNTSPLWQRHFDHVQLCSMV